jgi:hypothetical protein
MGLFSRITTTQVFTSLSAYYASLPNHPREMYAIQKAYYTQNGLYDFLHQALTSVGGDIQSIKPLRNPAYRAVEFYPAKLWPGAIDEAFTITADNSSIEEPIKQVWVWSNWAARKQVFARWFATYGDSFTKVVQTTDKSRVYYELLDPQYVSDFDRDERGYLTYVRIDIPRERRDAQGERKAYTYTEVWDKETQTLRIWEHDKGIDAPLDQLGTPKRQELFSAFGIDFVPIVHAPFKDIGEKRGAGCFTLQLDKIDEANRQATRLAQMLFRHAEGLFALESDLVDATGRPIPPPNLSTTNKTGADGVDRDVVDLGGSKFLKFPGGWHLTSLVPDIAYDSALAILQDHMTELENDLPELVYYRVRDLGTDISGRAVRLLLSGAEDKINEARGNAVAALIRLNQMALTIGQANGLKGFENLGGDYASGSFDHTIELPPVFELTDLEKMEELQAKSNLGVPQKRIWVEMGYSKDDINEMEAEREAEQTISERMLKDFETKAGGNG